MPLTLAAPELPETWFGPTGTMENSPRELFREVFETDLPISGGWGYSQDTCVAIEKDDDAVDQEQVFDGLAIESEFVKFRLYSELRVFREPGDMFQGIEWQQTSQKLIEENGRTFDVVRFYVRAWTERDWEALTKMFTEGREFLNDPSGLSKFKEERKRRVCQFEAEFWFDVTSFVSPANRVLH